jgi:hypothetical protein
LKAQTVDVNIKELTRVNATNINYNSSITDGKPLKLDIELFNSGSTGYKARIKFDIFDKDSNSIFTGWSDEKDFFPGYRKFYDLYWHPSNVKGKFKASIAVYFANEINKIKQINFEIKPSSKPPESIFEILDFRTYEDEVIFLVRTNKTVENVIFMPSNYPSGWVFEQNKIDKMENDNIKIIDLKYGPTLWKESDVTINIFTEDGKYYTSKSFSLKRETSFWKEFYGIVNTFRVLFKF